MQFLAEFQRINGDGESGAVDLLKTGLDKYGSALISSYRNRRTKNASCSTDLINFIDKLDEEESGELALSFKKKPLN